MGPISGDNSDSMKVGAETEAPSVLIISLLKLNLVFWKKKPMMHARLPLKSPRRKDGSMKRCTHHDYTKLL